MKFRIMNRAYYNIFENKYNPDRVGPVFVLCCRNEQGKYYRFRISDDKLKPHFYINKTDENIQKLKELTYDIEWEDAVETPIYNDQQKLLKVYTKFPYQVRKIRNFFDNHYNANIPWSDLAMMSLGLNRGFIDVPENSDWLKVDDIKGISEDEEFHVKPRIFYFDIETDFIEPSKKFDIHNQKIISIVVYDNYINKYDTFEVCGDDYWKEERMVKRSIKKKGLIAKTSKEVIHHCKNEKQLLDKFFRLFKRRPDALCGFNSHGANELKSYDSTSRRVWENGFDEPVVYIRAKHHRLDKQMQYMSPLPPYKNKWGRYYGVYKRGRENKCEIVIRGLTPLDIYFDFPKFGYREKYRDLFGRGLDDYLRYFAGVGKVEHKGLSVAELKEADLYKELRYNRRDVEGCVFLDEYFGYHNDVFDRIMITQCAGIDINVSTKKHNFLTLKYSQGKYVYDTYRKNFWEGWLVERAKHHGIKIKEGKKKAGGYNVKVVKGAHGWMVVMDFSRLYPNILKEANVGLDTLVQVKEEYDDYYIDIYGKKIMKKDCNITPAAPFLKADIKKAIDIQIWEDLIAYRNKLKRQKNEVLERTNDPDCYEYKLIDGKEYNLKRALLNDKFGVMGNYGYIGYCLPNYNVAPSIGQILIRELSEKFLPSIGYKCLAGDTDSIMPELKVKGMDIHEAVKEAEVLIEKANKFVRRRLKEIFDINTDAVLLAWEKIGPFCYFHAKKNYCLDVWAQDGKILKKKNRYTMYKGLELKKSNRSDVTEYVQKAYLDLTKKIVHEDLEYKKVMYDFILRIEEIFPYLSWTKVCSRINLKRKLEDYSENWQPKRAAEFSNKRFNTNYGNRDQGFLGIIKGKTSNGLSIVMMFKKKDIPKIKKLGYTIDMDWHKQKFVIDKLNNLFEDYGLGWHKIKKTYSSSSVMVI